MNFAYQNHKFHGQNAVPLQTRVSKGKLRNTHMLAPVENNKITSHHFETNISENKNNKCRVCLWDVGTNIEQHLTS